MSENDAYTVYRDARGRVRDAARWLVTILGSAIVLIIGGGLVSNIATLPLVEFWISVVAITLLFGVSVLPLITVIKILVPSFDSFETMRTDASYSAIRTHVEAHLALTAPTGRNSFDILAQERARLKAAYDNAMPFHREWIKKEWNDVEVAIRDVVELASIRRLEEGFRTFRRQMCITGLAGALLLGVLVVMWRVGHSRNDIGADRRAPDRPGVAYFVTFASGQACESPGKIPPTKMAGTGAEVDIQTLSRQLRDSGHTQLRVRGSADSQPLSRDARNQYGNDVSLALARAHCVAGALESQLAALGVPVSTVVDVRGPALRVASADDRTVEIRPLP